MNLSNLINFLINNPCEDPNVLKIILFIRKIMEIAFIAIPIVLIVLITFDFIKSVMANSEDTMKKNQKIVIKRLVYAVMLFFVMPIVNVAFSAFGTSGNDDKISGNIGEKKVNYLSCWDNAKDKDTINSFEVKVKFDGNGGTVYGEKIKTCGGSYSCEINSLPRASKKDEEFKGWSQNNSCNPRIEESKITVKNTDPNYEQKDKEDYYDMILYACYGDSSQNVQTPTDNNPSNNLDDDKVELKNDNVEKINKMINELKQLEGKTLSEVKPWFGQNSSTYYNYDWCSWFVWNAYLKYGFIKDEGLYSWFAGHGDARTFSYAEEWMFIGDGRFNGYIKSEVKGDLNYIPKPGDLILYVWDGSCCTNDKASHIGLVTGVDKNNVYTIEGNLSSKVQSVTRNLKKQGEYIGNISGGRIVGYYSPRTTNTSADKNMTLKENQYH